MYTTSVAPAANAACIQFAPGSCR